MKFLSCGGKNKPVRVFSAVLVICILCTLFALPSAVSAVSNDDDLVDIKNHWAEGVIQKWVSKGLAKGYGNGRFGPGENITRAEFVTLLNRIFGYEEKSEKSFPDVKPGAWYATELAKAYKAGIISGDSNGNMNPEAPISRQEAAVILCRAFSLIGDHPDTAPKYADQNQIADWALGSVGIMASMGYVTGRPGNLFAPRANLTRAEALKMIDNVMGEMINTPGTFTVLVPGNMTVSSPGVILKDTHIAGDLYLTGGIGSDTIQLIGVEVKGRTVIAGGKEVVLKGGFDRITVVAPQTVVSLEAGTVGNLVIDKGAEGARIEVKDGTVVATLTLYAGADITGGKNIKHAVISSGGVSMDKKPQQVTIAEGGQAVSYHSGNTQGQPTMKPTVSPSLIKPTDTKMSSIPLIPGSETRPTVAPTRSATVTPIAVPTVSPTKALTPTSTKAPTPTPTKAATQNPTKAPTPTQIPGQQKVYYIRQGANGAKDGTDWNNAWTQLPDVLERGATYYIASGYYPPYRFDDPEQGDEYIVIKKATVNDHGTDVGWKNGYGMGSSVFTGNKGPMFEFRTGYYIIDGQSGIGDSGHGIKLYNPANAAAHLGGNCMLIPNNTEVRYLTLRHIEMQDAGWAGSTEGVAAITRTVNALGTTSNITFQYCYIHESGQEWMLFVNPEKDFLIEKCYFKNGGSGSSDYHSVGVWFRGVRNNMNIQMRYNTFENFARTGGTGYITIGWRGDPETPTYSSGYYIYGNIFKETSTLAGPSRAIGSNGANGGPFLSDVKIFNNTFYKMRGDLSQRIVLANPGTDNLVANNIWYGCDDEPAFQHIRETNNIKNDLTYDPFVDAENGNFWLTRELPGGMVLAEPFNKDMDGAVRGADNVWDIGAFEYSNTRDERPRIENNTLVAPDASLLRGGTFWIYGWMSYKTDFALSDAPWLAIRENDLNAVRVACGYRPEKAGNYSLERYEEILEQIISRAESMGVTVVIDYHPEPGEYYSPDPEIYNNNKAHARAFWTCIASRFKDRKNVVFELVNEPVFDSPNDYCEELLQDFVELWQLCHGIAPEVPIIVMTFCQVGNHASDTRDWPSERAGWLEGIDWRKTAVGFHSYWRDSSERIVDLKNKYPCINTEFMTYPDGSGLKAMDGYDHHGTLMEQLGISWLQWDILDRQQSLDKLKVVIDDLKKHGVYWGD